MELNFSFSQVLVAQDFALKILLIKQLKEWNRKYVPTVLMLYNK